MSFLPSKHIGKNKLTVSQIFLSKIPIYVPVCSQNPNLDPKFVFAIPKRESVNLNFLGDLQTLIKVQSFLVKYYNFLFFFFLPLEP